LAGEQGAGRRIGHLHPPCIAEDEARGGGEAGPVDEITGGGASPAKLEVREQGNTARARRSQWGRGAGGAL